MQLAVLTSDTGLLRRTSYFEQLTILTIWFVSYPLYVFQALPAVDCV